MRRLVAATGHSRYPVSIGDLDHLKGVLYVKDVFSGPEDPSPEALEALVREPAFIPESAPILSVLQEMRAKQYVFGVVLDEHGGVEGVVTIKDLVGELIGTLRDEYDPGEPSAVAIGAHVWLVDGVMPLEVVASTIGANLPAGPYATAAGFFLALAGRIPTEGDRIAVDGISMMVVDMDRNRIDKIQFEVEAPSEAGTLP